MPGPSKDGTILSMENRRRVRPVKLYLAGPQGLAFDMAPGKLQRHGFDVVHAPPEPEDAREWNQWARYALALLLTCEGVALLPLSGGSRAVALKCQLAHELAMPVRTVPAWLTMAGQDAYMQRLIGN